MTTLGLYRKGSGQSELDIARTAGFAGEGGVSIFRTI